MSQTPELKNHALSTSGRSSTSGEEGFVSGCSLPSEENFDVLARQISALGVLSTRNNSNVYSSLLDQPIEEFASSLLTSDHHPLTDDASLMAANPPHQSYSTTTNRLGFPLANTTNLLGGPGAGGVAPPTTAAAATAGGVSNVYTRSSSTTSSHNQYQQQQLPGAWFYEMGPISGDETPGSGAASTGVPGDCSPIADFGEYHITESVEVPSSEHVAEIVGRQGCKIKALRAKTNTYIKTPQRGEDPIFLVTGRPADVMEAKREVECAADHFTQIRASRRHSQGGVPVPGHITTYVRVPLRVVGLVVGPKGATIKRIQQATNTYIVTPSREREPVFEVTGLPHNVENARREIEQHIFQRTGNMPITDPNAAGMTAYDMGLSRCSNGYTNSIHQVANGFGGDYRATEGGYGGTAMRGLKSTYNGSVSPTSYYANGCGGFDGMLRTGAPSAASQMVNNENIFQPTSTWSMGSLFGNQQGDVNAAFQQEMLSTRQHTTRANSFGNSNSLFGNTGNFLFGSNSRDEGLGDSPINSSGKFDFETHRMLSSIWGDLDTSATHEPSTTSVASSAASLAPQLATA